MTAQSTQTPEPTHRNDVELRPSSTKGILFQKSGTATERVRDNETRNELVPFSNNSQNCHNETQERGTTRNSVAMETTIFRLSQKQLHGLKSACER